MTQDGFKKALALLFSVHPQLEPKGKDAGFIYGAWLRMFCGLEDKQLLNAVAEFCSTHEKLYPGDSWIAIVRNMCAPVSETCGDCHELIITAVHKFGYARAKEAFEWLEDRSSLTAAVCRRIGYQDICMSENLDVVRGQIRAVFVEEKARADKLGGVLRSAQDLNNGSIANSALLQLAEKTSANMKKGVVSE